jgi:hypothetical protein
MEACHVAEFVIELQGMSGRFAGFSKADVEVRGAPVSQRMDVTSVCLWDFVDVNVRKNDYMS